MTSRFISPNQIIKCFFKNASVVQSIKKDIMIISICAPNNIASKYTKQIDRMKRRSTLFYNSWRNLKINRTTRQINKRTDDLKNIINQLYQTYIYRMLNNSKIYILLKCTWYTLQERPHARPQNKF